MKARSILPSLLLLASTFTSSPAQEGTLVRTIDEPLGIIDTVIIEGNEKTKDYVILNEMTLKPGMQATFEAVDFDRNRIYSIGLFTRVDIYYDSLGTTHFLFVAVRERWYLIPIPIFGFRYGDPGKIYFGAGFLHNNVGGRNQKLFASVTLGYDPSVSLSFFDPLIDRDNQLYLSGNLSYSRVRNKSEQQAALTGDFDEHHFNAAVTFGKRFNLYETAGITLGYQIVSVSAYQPGRTVDAGGRDNVVYGTLNYVYDSRDLGEYASRGFFASLSLTDFGFMSPGANFARYSADFRKFIPLPLGLTLAGRAVGSVVSGGEVPTYSHVYFGYGEKIRGYFRSIFEGEDMVGGSIELRYALLPPRTIQVTGLPVPEEFSIWRFGASLVLFTDSGVAWYRGDVVHVSSLRSGYGGGIHFLLPYGVVSRVEYAFDLYHKGQFILDFRGSF